MNNEYQRLWDAYTDAWKVETAEQKRALFRQCLEPECVYRDPLAVTTGWDELCSYMIDFHAMIPGGHFVTRRIRFHHDRSIAEWDMVDGKGTVIGDGISYGEYSKGGKIVAMTGFFDTPEPG